MINLNKHTFKEIKTKTNKLTIQHKKIEKEESIQSDKSSMTMMTFSSV
jgi:hypothetical protein